MRLLGLLGPGDAQPGWLVDQRGIRGRLAKRLREAHAKAKNKNAR
jgi:hypothetical protein